MTQHTRGTHRAPGAAKEGRGKAGEIKEGTTEGRRQPMIKIWQFRFAGQEGTIEIPYGELEAFFETLPLQSTWPFSKSTEDIRDLKLKKIGAQ